MRWDAEGVGEGVLYEALQLSRSFDLQSPILRALGRARVCFHVEVVLAAKLQLPLHLPIQTWLACDLVRGA